MTIGDRLKEVRRQLKLSQADFGRLGDVGKTTVLAWEHGTAFPNAAFLAAIAKLGADVGYIVTGESTASSQPLAAEEQVLLQHWRAAARPARNAALGALLGASLGKKHHVEQVFEAGVGQVIKGDATIHGATFQVHERDPSYSVAKVPASTKKVTRKP